MGQCPSIVEEFDHVQSNSVAKVAAYTYYSCLVASGIFAILAVVVSFVLIYKHLKYYTCPFQQRYIVRILLMVPFYAVDSWLSFKYPRYAPYFDVIRDCYEAFVIYNFFLLLLNTLGGFQVAQKVLIGKSITLPWPFNCFKFTSTGQGMFLTRCKQGTLQYVVIRPLMTMCALIMHACNVFCPGNLSPTHGYFWVSGVNFFSVSIAMYALIAFFVAVREELKPCNPLPKFLSIKFVIFFSFWQGVIVAGLMKVNIIRQTAHWTADDIGVGVQSFLVCIEMLIAAVVHIYAFGYRDYRPVDRRTSRLWKSVRHVISPRDLLVDLSLPVPQKKQLSYSAHSIRRRRDGFLLADSASNSSHDPDLIELNSLVKSQSVDSTYALSGAPTDMARLSAMGLTASASPSPASALGRASASEWASRSMTPSPVPFSGADFPPGTHLSSSIPKSSSSNIHPPLSGRASPISPVSHEPFRLQFDMVPAPSGSHLDLSAGAKSPSLLLDGEVDTQIDQDVSSGDSQNLSAASRFPIPRPMAIYPSSSSSSHDRASFDMPLFDDAKRLRSIL